MTCYIVYFVFLASAKVSGDQLELTHKMGAKAEVPTDSNSSSLGHLSLRTVFTMLK